MSDDNVAFNNPPRKIEPPALVLQLTKELIPEVVERAGGSILLHQRLEGELEVAERRDCTLWVRVAPQEIDWRFVSNDIKNWEYGSIKAYMDLESTWL